MIRSTTYTPHSYIDYAVDGGSVTTVQTVFSFPKNFLSLQHLEVWQLPYGGVWTQVTAFTPSGSSGSGTITLGGGAAARGVGDIIRIKRVTPDTQAGLLVDFVPGPLSSVDMDTAARQNLFIAQEIRDELHMTLWRETTTEADFSAEGRRITNLKAPSNATDAVRYQDIATIVSAGGALPGVTSGQVGSVLMVLDGGGGSGIWSAVEPNSARALMSIGTAALRNIGTGVADIPTISQADARYPQLANSLSELVATAATARANLGLGTAATLNVGTGASQVVQLNGSAQYPANDGRLIDLSNHPLVGNIGKFMALAVVDVGAYATTITGTSYTTIAVNSITNSQMNSDNDVTINFGAGQILLNNGAGNFWVTICLQLSNESTTQDATVSWRFRRAVTGTPVVLYTSPTSVIYRRVGSYQYSHLTVCRELLVATSGNDVCDVQIALNAPNSSGDVRVVEGHVFIRRIG